MALVWAALVAAQAMLAMAAAVPLPSEGPQSSCASTCPEAKSWSYEVGRTYDFSYHVLSTTMMKGTSDQKSEMELTVPVRITVDSECNFRMVVTNELAPFGNQLQQALFKYDLRFGFSNGRVTDVCAHPDETADVLNIKRGILSAFQNTFDGTYEDRNEEEVSVVGICPTEYTYVGASPGGASETFRKVKDMKECSQNQKLHQFALNIPDVNLQHLPLLESTHDCRFELREGLLSSSVCTERHLFKPFSAGDNGAVMEQTQKLIFKSSTKEEEYNQHRDDEPYERTTLLFDHSHEEQSREESRQLILDILSEITQDDASRSARPHQFSQLVHAMRQLRYTDLLSLFMSLEDPEAKRFMLDAVPLLRTEAGVELMKERLESGALSHFEREAWFATLTYYKNPTKKMIELLSPFIETAPSKSTLLGLSTLISTYCQSEGDCSESREVVRAVGMFERLLGASCFAMGPTEEDNVITALKGLRNIGFVIDSESVVQQCYKEASNPMEVRLAALDLIRYLNCRPNFEASFEDGLKELFTDKEKDSELRIAAYLGLMNCPTEETVLKVKELLNKEDVNQVGSFIWTHLTNLQESQSLSPSKRRLKQLIGDDFLQNKWNTDARKFSRYFESSYLAKELDVAATVEGSVIFSQASYMPRSAGLNLSVSVFGEHLNLLEVGGRAEGFESVLEDVFGPEGSFREDTFHKVLQSLRSKRDTDDEAKQLAQYQQTFNNYREEQPKGNYFLRIFGKDVHYDSFSGLTNLLNRLKSIPQSLFSNGQQLEYSRSSLFLNGGITVPTAAGLGLDLSVNGTYSLALKSFVSLDTARLFSERVGSISVDLEPTATVEVVGHMRMTCGQDTTGMKSVSRLHTDTVMDASVVLDGDNGVKAIVNAPRPSQEVVEASVDFYMYEDDAYVGLRSTNDEQVLEGCSGEFLDAMLAVEACASVRYHVSATDPRYLWAGPSSVRLGISKTDPFQWYAFNYRWKTDTTKPENPLNTFLVSFTTGGNGLAAKDSSGRHQTLVELVTDAQGEFLRFKVELPYKRVTVLAAYQWASALKYVEAKLAAAGVELVTAFAEVATPSPGQVKGQAFLTLVGRKLMAWEGGATFGNNKGSFELDLQSDWHKPLALSGHVTKSVTSLDLQAALKSEAFTGKSSLRIIDKDSTVTLRGQASYQVGSEKLQTIDVNGKYKTALSGELERYSYFLSVDPSAYPDYKTEFNSETQFSHGYVDNHGSIVVGESEYRFLHRVSLQDTPRHQERGLTVEWQNVAQATEYKLEFLTKTASNDNHYRLALSFGRSLLEAFVRHRRDPDQQELSAGLTYPGVNYRAGVNLENVDHLSYKGGAHLEWGTQPDQSIRADFQLLRGEASTTDYEVIMDLLAFNWKPVHLGGTLRLRPDLTKINLKWKYSLKHYQLLFEHGPIEGGLEAGIHALLKVNEIEYSALAIYRFDEIMSALQVDVKAEKHLSLTFKHQARDLELALFWDKAADLTKSVTAKALLQPYKISASFNVLTYGGSMNLERKASRVEAAAIYRQHFANASLDWAAEDTVVGIKAAVATSFEDLKHIRLIAKYATNTVQEGTKVKTRLAVQWNDADHSLETEMVNLIGQYRRLQLHLKSTHEPLNDIKLKAKFDASKGLVRADVLAEYHGLDLLRATCLIDGLAEGTVTFNSPLLGVAQTRISYNNVLHDPGHHVSMLAKVSYRDDAANALTVGYNRSVAAGVAKVRAHASLLVQAEKLLGVDVHAQGESRLSWALDAKASYRGRTATFKTGLAFLGQRKAGSLVLANDASRLEASFDLGAQSEVGVYVRDLAEDALLAEISLHLDPQQRCDFAFVVLDKDLRFEASAVGETAISASLTFTDRVKNALELSLARPRRHASELRVSVLLPEVDPEPYAFDLSLAEEEMLATLKHGGHRETRLSFERSPPLTLCEFSSPRIEVRAEADERKKTYLFRADKADDWQLEARLSNGLPGGLEVDVRNAAGEALSLSLTCPTPTTALLRVRDFSGEKSELRLERAGPRSHVLSVKLPKRPELIAELRRGEGGAATTALLRDAERTLAEASYDFINGISAELNVYDDPVLSLQCSGHEHSALVPTRCSLEARGELSWGVEASYDWAISDSGEYSLNAAVAKAKEELLVLKARASPDWARPAMLEARVLSRGVELAYDPMSAELLTATLQLFDPRVQIGVRNANGVYTAQLKLLSPDTEGRLILVETLPFSVDRLEQKFGVNVKLEVDEIKADLQLSLDLSSSERVELALTGERHSFDFRHGCLCGPSTDAPWVLTYSRADHSVTVRRDGQEVAAAGLSLAGGDIKVTARTYLLKVEQDVELFYSASGSGAWEAHVVRNGETVIDLGLEYGNDFARSGEFNVALVGKGRQIPAFTASLKAAINSPNSDRHVVGLVLGPYVDFEAALDKDFLAADVDLSVNFDRRRSTFILDSEYSWREESKEVGLKMALSERYHNSLFEVSWNPNEARLQIDLLALQAGFEVSRGVGQVLAKAEWARSTLFEATLEHNLLHVLDDAGSATLDVNALDRHRHRATFDLERLGSGKRALKLTYSRNEDELWAALDSKFQLSYDTFASQTTLRSSESGVDDVVVLLKYDIRAVPEIKLQVSKEAAFKRVLNMKVDLKTAIPTVSISTNIPGYESLLLRGEADGCRVQKCVFSVILERNKERIVVMDLKHYFSQTLRSVSVAGEFFGPWSSMTDPISAKLGATWREPYSFYCTVLDRHGEPMLDAQTFLSIEEPEVRVSLVTPFHEDVFLSGKTGTTSLGKSFGVDFSVDRVRRHLGLLYEHGEGGTNVELRTPLEAVHQVKLRRRTRSLSEQEFSFEILGVADQEAALGIAYDMRDPLSQGSLKASLRLGSALSPFNAVDAELQYTLDEDSSLHLTSHCNKDNEELYHLDVNIDLSNHPTERVYQATLSTPLKKYKTVSLNVKDQSPQSMSMLYSKNGKDLYKASYSLKSVEELHIQLHDLKKDRRNDITCEKNGNDYSLTYSLNEKPKLTLTANVDLEHIHDYSETGERFGSITFDCFATKNLWSKAGISFSKNRTGFEAGLELETSFPKLKLAKIAMQGASNPDIDIDEAVNFTFNWNDQYYTYRSTSYDGEGWHRGKTVEETNIPFFGYSKSITTTNIHFASPLADIVEFSKVQDGKTVVDLSLKVEVDPNSFHVDAGVLIAKLSPKKYQLELRVSGIRQAKNILLQIKTNISGYETIVGRISRQYKADASRNAYNHQIKGIGKVNGEECLKVAAGLKVGEQSKAMLQVEATDHFRQKIEVELDGKNKAAAVKLQGSLIKLEATGNVNLNEKTQVVLVNFACKGALPLTNSPFDVSAKVLVRKTDLEVLLINNRAKRQHKISATYAYTSIYDCDFGFALDSTVLNDINIGLAWQLDTGIKSVAGVVKVHDQFDYGIDTMVDWAPEESDVIVAIKLDDQEYKLIGKRRGVYETISYGLTGFGEEIKLKSQIKFDSPQNFELEASLDIPILEKTTSLKAASSSLGKGFLATGSFSINEKSLGLDWKCPNIKKTFTLKVQSSFPMIPGFSLKLRHEDHVKGLTLEVEDFQFGVESNVLAAKKVSSDVDLFFTVTSKMQDTRKITITINRKAKELSAVYLINGEAHAEAYSHVLMNKQEKHFKLNLEVILHPQNDFQGFHTEFEGEMMSQDGEQTLTITVMLNKERLAHLELSGKFGKKIKKYAKVNAMLEFVKDAEKKVIQGYFEMDNQGDEKTLTADFTGPNGGHFSVNIKKQGPITIDGEIKLDAPDLSKSFELEFSFDNGVASIELEHGESELELKASGLGDNSYFLLNIECEGKEYKMSGNVDFGEKAMNFKSHFDGKDISLTVTLTDNVVSIKMSTPFNDYRDIALEGSYDIQENGLEVSAQGSVDGQPATFTLSLECGAGGKNLQLELITAQTGKIIAKYNSEHLSPTEIKHDLLIDINGRLQSLNAHTFCEEKFFKLVYALKLDCECIPIKELRSETMIGLKNLKNFQLSKRVQARKTGEELKEVLHADLTIKLKAVDNVSVKLIAGAHGIPKNGIEATFRIRSLQDFEVSGGATIMSSPYVYGLKHFRGEGNVNSGIKFSSPVANLDIELVAHDYSDEVAKKWSGHIEDKNGLFRIALDAMANVESKSGHVRGELVAQDFTGDIKLMYKKAEEIAIVAQLMPWAQIQGQLSMNGNILSGNLRLRSEAQEAMNKAVSIIIEYGSEGAMELTFTDGAEEASIRLRRDIGISRASYRHEQRGSYTFETDRNASSGSFSFHTGSRKHHVTYRITPGDVEFNAVSPSLPYNGLGFQARGSLGSQDAQLKIFGRETTHPLLSLNQEQTDNGYRFDFATPLPSLRGVTVKRSLASNGEEQFSFELQSLTDKDAALGIAYDMRDPLSHGSLKASLRLGSALSPFSAVDAALQYSLEEDNSLHLTSSCSKDNEELYHLEVNIDLSNHPTERVYHATLSTPLKKYKTVSLNVQDQLPQSISMLYSKNGKDLYKASYKFKNDEKLHIQLHDLKKDRRNDITCEKIGNEYSLTYSLNEKPKLTLSTVVDLEHMYYSESGEPFGSITFDCFATKNLWSKAGISFSKNRTGFEAALEVETSFPKLKLAKIRIEGENHPNEEIDEAVNLYFNWNEQYYTYKSTTAGGDGWRRSKTVEETNMPMFGYSKSITSTDIHYPYFTFLPDVIKFSKVQDGEEIVDLSLKLENDPNSFKLNVAVLIAKVSPKRYEVELLANGIRQAKNVLLQIKTNVPGYESIVGKISRQYKPDASPNAYNHQIKAIGKVNGEEFLKVAAGLKLGAFFKAMLQIEAKEKMRQKAEVQYDQKTQSASLKLQGSLMRMEVSGNFDADKEAQTARVNIYGKGNLPLIKMPFDVAAKVHASTTDLMILLVNKKTGTEHKITAEYPYTSLHDCGFGFTLDSTNVNYINIGLQWSLDTAIKSVSGAAKIQDQFDYGLDVLGKWSPEKSNVIATIYINDQQYKLTGERKGVYETISYGLTGFGEEIKLKSKIKFDSPQDFELEASLDIPILEKTTSLKAASSSLGKGFMATGSFSINEKSLGLDWKCPNIKKTFTLKVQSSFPMIPGFSLKLRHEDHVKGLTLEVEDFQFGVESNVLAAKKVSSDVDLFFTVTSKMQDTRKITITINRKAKELSAVYLINGEAHAEAYSHVLMNKQEKHFKLNLEVILHPQNDFQGFHTEFEGEMMSQDGEQTLTTTVMLNKERLAHLELGGKFGKKMKKYAKVNAMLEFVKDAEKKVIQGDFEMDNQGDEKTLTADITGPNGGHFSVNIKKQGPITIDGEIKLDAPDLSKSFELEFSFDNGVASIELEHGESELELKASGLGDNSYFLLNIECEGKEYKMSGNVDFGEKAMNFKSHFDGKDISLTATLTDNVVSIKMSTPFNDYRDIALEGSYDIQENGLEVSAQGSVDGQPATFTLSLECGAGGKNLQLELITAQTGKISAKYHSEHLSPTEMKHELLVDVNGRLQSLNARIFIEESHFNLVYSMKLDCDSLTLKELRSETKIGLKSLRNFRLSKRVQVRQSGGELKEVLHADLTIKIEAADDISVKLIAGAQGLPKNGIEATFRIRSLQDFEVAGGATIMCTPYVYGLKHFRGEGNVNSGIKFSSPVANLDIELVAHDYSDEVAKKWSGHIEDKNGLFRIALDAMANVESKSGHVRGELVAQDFTGDIKLTYKKAEEIAIVAQLMPWAQIQGQLSMNGNILSGNLRLRSEVQETLNKAISISIESGPEGAMELTFTDGAAHSSIRVRRDTGVTGALFSSSDLGSFNLNFNRDMSSGILALKVGHSLHKLTYTAEFNEVVDLSAELDSFSLFGGRFGFHVSGSPKGPWYDAKLYHEDDEFFSSSFSLKEEREVWCVVRLVCPPVATFCSLSRAEPSTYSVEVRGAHSAPGNFSATLSTRLGPHESSLSASKAGARLQARLFAPLLRFRDLYFHADLTADRIDVRLGSAHRDVSVAVRGRYRVLKLDDDHESYELFESFETRNLHPAIPAASLRLAWSTRHEELNVQLMTDSREFPVLGVSMRKSPQSLRFIRIVTPFDNYKEISGILDVTDRLFEAELRTNRGELIGVELGTRPDATAKYVRVKSALVRLDASFDPETGEVAVMAHSTIEYATFRMEQRGVVRPAAGVVLVEGWGFSEGSSAWDSRLDLYFASWTEFHARCDLTAFGVQKSRVGLDVTLELPVVRATVLNEGSRSFWRTRKKYGFEAQYAWDSWLEFGVGAGLGFGKYQHAEAVLSASRGHLELAVPLAAFGEGLSLRCVGFGRELRLQHLGGAYHRGDNVFRELEVGPGHVFAYSEVLGHKSFLFHRRGDCYAQRFNTNSIEQRLSYSPAAGHELSWIRRRSFSVNAQLRTSYPIKATTSFGRTSPYGFLFYPGSARPPPMRRLSLVVHENGDTKARLVDSGLNPLDLSFEPSASALAVRLNYETLLRVGYERVSLVGNYEMVRMDMAYGDMAVYAEITRYMDIPGNPFEPHLSILRLGLKGHELEVRHVQATSELGKNALEVNNNYGRRVHPVFRLSSETKSNQLGGLHSEYIYGMAFFQERFEPYKFSMNSDADGLIHDLTLSGDFSSGAGYSSDYTLNIDWPHKKAKLVLDNERSALPTIIELSTTLNPDLVEATVTMRNRKLYTLNTSLKKNQLPSLLVSLTSSQDAFNEEIFVGLQSDDTFLAKHTSTHDHSLVYSWLQASLEPESGALVVNATWDPRSLRTRAPHLPQSNLPCGFSLKERVDSMFQHMVHVCDFVIEEDFFSTFDSFSKLSNALRAWLNEYLQDFASKRGLNLPERDPEIIVKILAAPDVLFNEFLQIINFAIKDGARFAKHAVIYARETCDQLNDLTIDFLNLFTFDIDIDVEAITVGLKRVGKIIYRVYEKILELRDKLFQGAAGQITIKIKAFLVDFRQQVLSAMRKLSAYLRQFHVVREIIQIYVDYQSWLEEVHFTRHLERAVGDFKASIDRVTGILGHVADFLSVTWHDFRWACHDLYESVTSSPGLYYLTTPLKRLSELTSALLQHLSLETNLYSVVSEAIGQADVVSSAAIRLANILIYWDEAKSHDVELDVENRTLIYTQYLPFEWSSFTEKPPIIEVLFPAEQPQDGEEFNFVQFQHDILDLLNTLDKVIVSRNVMPPFSAHALLTAHGQLKSFDGKMLVFGLPRRQSGDVDYLLTSDFLHNHFSLSASFGPGGWRQLSLTGGQATVQLRRDDRKVTVNGRLVALPQDLGAVFVGRDGERIVLEHRDGLRVQCNMVFHVCSVTLSGWYFGKTGGLLGVYDNEPSNDWMTPDRRLAATPDEFAASWLLGEAPKRGLDAVARDDALSELGASDAVLCEELFSADESALMPCFETVRPEPYQALCADNFRRLANVAVKEKEGLCHAAAAYIEACRLEGVELWMPSDCITCQVPTTPAGPSRLVQGGESLNFMNNAPWSADVVFLVEQQACLEGVQLNELPRLIDLGLQDQGLKANQFALVGFGGEGRYEKPQVFTAQSTSVFDSREKIEAAFDGLKLSESSPSPTDLFGALQFAGRLHFRPAVSKSFVLFTCGASDISAGLYGDALTMIREQNISLHVVSPNEFNVARKAQLAAIYGFNSEAAFTKKTLTRPGNPDRSLRKQIRPPKDYISTISLESRGSIFKLQSFAAEADRLQSKRAGTVLGAQVGLQGAPADCQVCDCLPSRDGEGALQCRKCVLPQVDVVLETWKEQMRQEQAIRNNQIDV